VGALGTLGCLARFSAVSVGAYGALAVLGITLPLRLHRAALRALVMGVEGTLRDQETRGAPQAQGQRGTGDMGHEDSGGMGDTRGGDGEGDGDAGLCLQFAFLFYLLTYVGAVCNGLTLLGAGVICAFTFPVLYRHHQAQIDQYMSLVRNHLSHLRARLDCAGDVGTLGGTGGLGGGGDTQGNMGRHKGHGGGRT
uniref:Reticulon n=1 Tax=Accipiter nisus TaxID=211598 RepID=A0A8B9N510_9AVES